QLASGSLNVNVGGTTAGTLYSEVKISGKASLGGTLAVTLINSFTPTVGQTFTVLTATGALGGTTFSNTTIAINSTEQFDISYTSTGVVLTVVAVGPSNENGKPAQNSAQSSAMAVVEPTSGVSKSTLLSAHNNLRHALGVEIGKRVEVASAGSGSERVVVPDATGISTPRAWEHIPVTPLSSWDHVKAITIAQTLRTINSGGAKSDLAHRVENWTGAPHALPVQAALTRIASQNHRVPVHFFHPALPVLR
ncbi:MAG TPA: hypothetical protein VMD99_17415, partial [Terriglobales bacterium]|nr:hypothetical protein [Terriglobales bacterium]